MSIMKRSVMTLYSEGMDVYSHQVRLVLAEKGVSVDVVTVDDNHPCEELAELNPYNSLPTLVDRNLVLYQPQVIMEYLDERFPHPPLLPVYPVSRAKSRLMMYRVERDWYGMLRAVEAADDAASLKQAKSDLQDCLVSLAPVFAEMPYFLSEEYTMVDCAIAPLLWRLPLYGIKLPKQAKSIFEYQDRIFSRETFQASLSESEREIHEDVI